MVESYRREFGAPRRVCPSTVRAKFSAALRDPQLVKELFRSSARTPQNLRKFRDDAHEPRSAANPEDLNATARIFYYYQQQGKTEVAQQAIADFRLHKGSRQVAVGLRTRELFYLRAPAGEDIHAYPESARYYFVPSTTATVITKTCPTRRRPPLLASPASC